MMTAYEFFLRPWLFLLNPERAHRLARRWCRLCGGSSILRGWLHNRYTVEDPRLAITVAGISFPNPVGLAAGFDRTGEMMSLLPHLGFGFIEVGSVTRLPWAGNPPPRIFRLPKDRALINRVGLSNPGAQAASEWLAQALSPIPEGINVAKTPDPLITGHEGEYDFIEGVMTLYPYADYITLNVSCPNAPDGRTFEDPELLSSLITGIRAREAALASPRRAPIFVKLSPDLAPAALDQVVMTCIYRSVNGLIIGNTTESREGLRTAPNRLASIGRGGLSGRPLLERVIAMTAHVYRLSGGLLPIIGCGGIFTGEDAYRVIRAGASLVQLYTGLVYRGPAVAKEINLALLRCLEVDAIPNIGMAVGRDA